MITIESLKQAIIDADKALGDGEGVGLLHYLEYNDDYAQSMRVIAEVLSSRPD